MSWSGCMRSHLPNLFCLPPSTPTTHLKSGFIMAQKNGLEAIGAVICRYFGADGYFEGSIIGVSFTTDGDSLYRVKYTDGDTEDLDQEEYNYAYSLYLQREGWTPMEGEDYGSDSNHSDNSDSTLAYKPSKVCCYISVCLFASYCILIAACCILIAYDMSRMMMTMMTSLHHCRTLRTQTTMMMTSHWRH